MTKGALFLSFCPQAAQGQGRTEKHAARAGGSFPARVSCRHGACTEQARSAFRAHAVRARSGLRSSSLQAVESQVIREAWIAPPGGSGLAVRQGRNEPPEEKTFLLRKNRLFSTEIVVHLSIRKTGAPGMRRNVPLFRGALRFGTDTTIFYTNLNEKL